MNWFHKSIFKPLQIFVRHFSNFDKTLISSGIGYLFESIKLDNQLCYPTESYLLLRFDQNKNYSFHPHHRRKVIHPYSFRTSKKASVSIASLNSSFCILSSSSLCSSHICSLNFKYVS